jgi:uncharacterized repeat protein (TIGR03806 family)
MPRLRRTPLRVSVPLHCLSGLCVAAVLLGSAAAEAQPYGLAGRPAIGRFLNDALPETAPRITGNWSAVVAFPNLLFTNALGLAAILGTNRLCVWEREGRVYSFENTAAAGSRTLVLDIHNQCQGWDDSGLLNIVFHPGFVTNHYMFVYYTWVIPGTVQGSPTTRPPTFVTGAYHDRLSRFTLDDSGVANPSSELVLVDQVGNSVWHNGSGMFFHPGNGFLYIADGDDADGSNNQRIDRNLFSGIWRIDVDMRGGAISHPIVRQPANGSTANYYVPNDNPFVGQANVLEEFYALGLRSPHRMTCDPLSGRIFLGDVGEGSREEIDLVEPGDPSGLNFQWNRIEGLQGDLIPPYIGVNKRPILDYPHSEGAAVIGGYVYRGAEFSVDLGGRYIFGDNVSRSIWALDESTIPAAKIYLCTLPLGSGPNSGSDYTGLSSFGLDANNELYLCQMSSVGGRIYKLARSGPPPLIRPFPALLSQTGAFADLPALTPAAGLVPYAVNSPLWSDGALKQRWVALPTNTTISFAPTGEWTFPTGTVFVKHFDLPANETNASVVRRLETRLLVRDTNGTSYGVTYKWRPGNLEADVVTNAMTEDILVQTASGIRTQQWYFPSPADCLRCHTAAARFVLGVKTRQLNGNLAYPDTGVSDNQLRSWNHVGLLSPSLNESAIPSYDQLVALTNTGASLEVRARSYLDSNCAQCHRPGGVPALWDARFDTPLTNQNIINGTVANTLGIAGAKVVVPQDIGRSIMHRRVSSLDAFRMPPLARNLVDSNAVAVLADWINSLPPSSTALPLGWSHQDIGSVGLAGDAAFAAGSFTVTGGGDDIWNNADAFHFAYRHLNGDGELIARVAGVQNTDAWAKAGVMIRESLTAGSRHAMAVITAGNGAAFQRRLTTGGASTHAAGPFVSAPYWVRLTRAGSTFTAYASANGSTWTLIGNDTITMASNVFIGLAVTAHNNSALNSSTLDNVSGNFGPNMLPVATLLSPTNNSPFTAFDTVRLSATANDSDGAIANVAFFAGPNQIVVLTNAPYIFYWSNVNAGSYSLTARATDDRNGIGVSSPANITVSPLAITLATAPLTNGHFQLRFNAPDLQRFVIESSENFLLWVPLETNAPSGGIYQFIDVDALVSHRFYRIKPWP